jgi:hypothetical protein
MRLILLGALSAFSSLSLWASPGINDLDLAGPAEKRELFKSSFVMPDVVESRPHRNGETTAQLVFIKDGKRFELSSPDFKLDRKCQSGVETFRAYAYAETARFVIKDRSSYEFGFQGHCGHEHTLIYHDKTAAGELASVWDVATTAERKMQQAGILDLWTRQVQIIFPADGDYYSGDKVRVTKGYQWDVVGHELGHAIYDQSRMGAFGGGPHRIDECYSDALALSEGWASFFAAWLKVDKNDPDAKFEYMVPRRAPLRFEHVPADVCQGPRNEWRVTAFLWDLIDLNRDDEEVEEGFAKLWRASAGKRSRGIEQMKEHFKSAGVDHEGIEAIWQKNFYDR